MRIRRVVSRSHPVKTIFMGVLTSPIPERNFNGVLALKKNKQTRDIATRNLPILVSC
jgi:hypothetical protein